MYSPDCASLHPGYLGASTPRLLHTLSRVLGESADGSDANGTTVVDDLAVVGQAAGSREGDFAAQAAFGADRLAQGLGKLRLALFRLADQPQLIQAAGFGDFKARFDDVRKSADDIGHLLGVDEHAAHLCGLVGAPHPALQPDIGAPAWRAARHDCGKIARREAD